MKLRPNIISLHLEERSMMTPLEGQQKYLSYSAGVLNLCMLTP